MEPNFGQIMGKPRKINWKYLKYECLIWSKCKKKNVIEMPDKRQLQIGHFNKDLLLPKNYLHKNPANTNIHFPCCTNSIVVIKYVVSYFQLNSKHLAF